MIINCLSFLFIWASIIRLPKNLPSCRHKKRTKYDIPMYGKHLIYFLHWLHQQDNTDYSIQCVSLTLGPSTYIKIYIPCQSYNSTHKMQLESYKMETNTPQTRFMDRLILIWQIFFSNLIRMTKYLWFKSMQVQKIFQHQNIVHIRGLEGTA